MRPKLAVFKFASCDGCQLSILDCEDELLALAGAVEIANFLEASSAVTPGPYDVGLVEGSITTAHDAERILEVRKQVKKLVTIGACATSGGVQALRNARDHAEMVRYVYARPEFIDTLATSTPIAAHVTVDYELRGCPVDRAQLLEVLSALLNGRKPAISAHSVCLDCKMAGNVCVMVAHGTPCLGPITHAGCGALCPGVSRGCYGCFGPSASPSPRALGEHLARAGAPDVAVRRLLTTFNAGAPAFAEEARRHGDE